MTERKRSSNHRGSTSRGTFAVVPLLFLCCLSIASYMIATYVTVYSESITQGSESSGAGDQTSSNTNDGTEVTEPALLVPVAIGSYTAASSSTEAGRETNIRLAAESINGSVLQPGETFSFNTAVGDVENDARYQLAPVVFDSEMIYGRGGGSCQVSTALYLAALYANLRIEERHAHSMVVDYAPIGLDATIVYGSFDLRIVNDTEFPITIVAKPEGQTVTVTILGQPLEQGISIKPLSTVIEYHAEGTYLPDGMEWDADLFNSSFYIVESYRKIYYHGNETDTVLLARDLYLVYKGSTVMMPDGSNLETTK